MMTIQDFRENTEKVLEFRAILNNPLIAEVMGILRETENLPVKSGITDIEAAILLGDSRGFARYARLFANMAEMWPLKRGRPEETYGTKKE